MGIGIDTSIASANEVTEAIAKQEDDKPNGVLSSKPAAKRAPAAKKATTTTERDPELMSKAISYIISKKGDQFTDKQKEGIMKFVR